MKWGLRQNNIRSSQTQAEHTGREKYQISILAKSKANSHIKKAFISMPLTEQQKQRRDHMVTISSIVETTAVLSDEQNKRYEYTKVFKNEKGKKVLLIMLNASGTSQIHTMDNTTNLTISNLSELGYSTITVWNLFPLITAKLNSKNVVLDNDNFNYLKNLLKKKYDSIVIGWGTSLSTNKIVKQAKEQAYKLLKPYEKVLVQIEDNSGKYNNSHPLFAGLYFNHQWTLGKYNIPDTESKSNADNQKEKKENSNDGKNMDAGSSGTIKQGEVLAMYAEHEAETSGTDSE